jgi:hypothetical protein
MHRAILQACLPWFFWLCVASGLVLLLVQFCGSRIDWRRLRHLSRGEEGSVQSLSLVLTLPVFLLLVLFIVQVTQVMVGIMMVNYAAFAAARAASVWIPADVTTELTFRDPPFDNRLIFEIDPSSASVVSDRILPDGTIDSSLQRPLEPANVVAATLDRDTTLGILAAGGYAVIDADNEYGSYKYEKILMAGVIPCLTISPSRNLTSSGRSPGTSTRMDSAFQSTFFALAKLYPQVDPRSQSNTRMPFRLSNKLRYAANHTTVALKWQNVAHPNRDVAYGPTYNPAGHPATGVPEWNPNEIGFRDPVTVSVTHDFALLPGIGRILSYAIDQEDATKKEKEENKGDDRTAALVSAPSINNGEYTVKLEASATFVNEGFKSLVRYAIQP